MRRQAVDHLTRAREWSARLTPAERRAGIAIGVAWLVGGILQGLGWHDAPGRWVAERLSDELPRPAVVAARFPPGDPRVEWYAAGFALREERRRAASGPERLDPNTADRADWDRLPRIGPRTAEAILAVRAERGGFEAPEDLLEVRGIGPVTLEGLRSWLAFSDPPTASAPRAGEGGVERRASGRRPPRKPDLNRVGERFLMDLPKIGPHLASDIYRERGRRGGFRDWADVRAIEGVGPSRLAVLQNATRIPNPRPSGETMKSEDR